MHDQWCSPVPVYHIHYKQQKVSLLIVADDDFCATPEAGSQHFLLRYSTRELVSSGFADTG